MQTDQPPLQRRTKSKIEPVKLDSSGKIICRENNNLGARVDQWRVTFGKKITGGRKERRFFATEKEAKEEVAKRVAEKGQYGDAAISLDHRAEMARCLARLKPFSASLTEAVEFFVKHAPPPDGKRLRFDEVKDLFLKDRSATGKESTLAAMKSRLDSAGQVWGKRTMSEIGSSEIKRWLDSQSIAPKTRNNYIGDMANLFNFAISEKYCGVNPLSEVKKAKVVHDEPEKLTPSQARNLLLASLEECPEITAALAISLFAGLRRSELCSLDWGEVHLAEREIIVTAEKSKVSTRRVVSISENLVEWLSPLKRESGPVAYYKDRFSADRKALGVDSYGNKLSQLAAARPGKNGRPAIVSPWIQNGPRHSFCSYFYGRVKNLNLTASEAGNSPGIIERYYKGLARDAEVKEYWSIVPQQHPANVISLTGAVA